MGFLGRFEKKVEGAVSGVFARAFKGDVQPVEIAARLQRELDTEAKLMSRDKRLVPNEFVVSLSQHDHDKLVPYSGTLTTELASELRRHAGEMGYVFNGPIRIHFELDEALPVGRFTVSSEAVAGVESSRPWSGQHSGRSGDPPGSRIGRARQRVGPSGHGASRSPTGPVAMPPPREPVRPGPTIPTTSRTSLYPPSDQAGRGQPPCPVPAGARAGPGGQRHPPSAHASRIRDRPRAPRPTCGSTTRASRGCTPRSGSTGAGPEQSIDIVDLGSTNGIVVNGQRVRHSVVVEGTRIEIGSTRMLVHAPSGR